MTAFRNIAFAASLALAAAASPIPVSAQPTSTPPATRDISNEEVQKLARDILRVGTLDRNRVMARLVERGDTDVVPALIQSLRFLQQDPWTITSALQSLTGENHGKDWNKWMLWQEAHPEIVPFEGFAAYKEWVLTHIDPNFSLFLHEGVAHAIRLEEIAWGGVVRDGIPALVNPRLVAPDHAEAAYLDAGELVFGIEINGDVRAYPLRMMDWHEMFNDVIGDVPVALAYCTLCGSGILFETAVDGQEAPFEFGSSGFLYRSNKLMFDRATNSLWNQFTGRPVVGELVGSDIELKVRPVAITTWAKWLSRHPDTRVLSIETGFDRDYTPGKPYAAYLNSPNLMFPARVNDTRLAAKDYVYALRMGADEKAWSLALFEDSAVIHDMVGGRDIVLVGDAATRTVRAYESAGLEFGPHTSDGERLVSASGEWLITEDALVGAGGRRLERLPGHIAYWFAWQNFRPEAPTRFE